MSEIAPKRKIGDKIQVMNTIIMQKFGLANKEGTIIEVLAKGMFGVEDYKVKLKDIQAPIVINGFSLRKIDKKLLADRRAR